jgi:hypothetical protein
MAIELLLKEIQRFLASREPEVLCVTGDWGVGKTFAWNRYLHDAKAAGKIALKRYAYVSLFGVNSLDALKYSIFESSVGSDAIGIQPNLQTLHTNTVAVAKQLGRKSFGFIQQIPFMKNYVGTLPIWFFSVSDTIICLDDIERRGTSLSFRDVFGLTLTLKEQKNCKVVLILNSEAVIEDADERKAFDIFLEKVVDVRLAFAPSPQECVSIALAPDTPAIRQLAENCVALGISNIRVIRKIERLVRRLAPLLEKYDDNVLTQAVQSLALLGWSFYEPGKAPPLEFLKSRRPFDYMKTQQQTDMLGLKRVEPVTDEKASWNALLDAYGFVHMDEFDRLLLDGVRNGYFDEAKIQNLAAPLDRQARAAKADSSLKQAWSLYHDSFDDNEKDVVDAIYTSYMGNVQFISPMNFDGTVRVLKTLGRTDLAAEAIRCYFEQHKDVSSFADIQETPFAAEIKDPDVLSAFNEKLAAISSQADPATILLNIAKNQGWGPDDITVLSNLPIDEYYKIFKSKREQDLARVISACLLFDRVAGATDAQKEIPRRAKAALKRIGLESPLNALRMTKYGMQLDADQPPG